MILSLLIASLGTAEAKSNEPFMWGVGPNIGTYLYPFSYPSNFPKGKDGSPSPRDNMDSMDGDFQIGAKGTLYMNRDYRLWGLGNIHRGSSADYKGRSLTVGVDKILLRENGLNFFVGGGGGMGQFTFDQKSENGKLSGRQLYFRANAGALYRNVKQAYEFSVFGMLGTTGEEVYEYNDVEYTNEGIFSAEGAEDSLSGGLYMPVFGVEATVYFGDFKPNKKGGKGKK
jgi:hypothetical protein